VTSKAASLAALVSGLVIGARAHAQVAPEPHDTLTQTDDADREPTSSAPRVEGDAAAGTDAARHAELRASARHGNLDLSLAGGLDDRSDRHERAAGATFDRSTGVSRLVITGALTDTALDLAISSVGIQTRSGGVTWSSGRHEIAGLDHELVLAACFTSSSGTASTSDDDDTDHMGVLERLKRSDHRFLEAYLKDTLHVIETLDVSGGFVFDDWRNLSAIETIRYGTDEAMDVHAPSLEDMHFSPQLGAVYRATKHVTLLANASREMRAPTLGELYVPLVLGGAAAEANAQLHPEVVLGGSAGPEVRFSGASARAIGFVHEVDAPIAIAEGERTNLDHARVLGVATSASWRPARPVLATVSYVRTESTIRDAAYAGNQLSLAPRHRAGAELAVDAPHVATLTAGVRWLGRQYIDAENTQAVGATTLVDATATRAINHGLAAYVSVENLLDRRYVATHDLPGAGRTVQLGIRVDSARF
jgi:outer membrane receptor for monomeric catechols